LATWSQGKDSAAQELNADKTVSAGSAEEGSAVYGAGGNPASR
jgi:hypothetical protein